MRRVSTSAKRVLVTFVAICSKMRTAARTWTLYNSLNQEHTDLGVIFNVPKVWNKRDPNTPKDAIYVGRPTKWGNPYSHLPSTLATFKVDTREHAVLAHASWIGQLEQRALYAAIEPELKGKDLVCWCSPKSCHADTLLRIANDECEDD